MIIYLEQTILLLSKSDPQMVQDLIDTGQIKQSLDNKPYLVIQDERHSIIHQEVQRTESNFQ